jgi:hypothetical protein
VVCLLVPNVAQDGRWSQLLNREDGFDDVDDFRAAFIVVELQQLNWKFDSTARFGGPYFFDRFQLRRSIDLMVG